MSTVDFDEKLSGFLKRCHCTMHPAVTQILSQYTEGYVLLYLILHTVWEYVKAHFTNASFSGGGAISKIPNIINKSEMCLRKEMSVSTVKVFLVSVVSVLWDRVVEHHLLPPSSGDQ